MFSTDDRFEIGVSISLLLQNLPLLLCLGLRFSVMKVCNFFDENSPTYLIPVDQSASRDVQMQYVPSSVATGVNQSETAAVLGGNRAGQIPGPILSQPVNQLQPLSMEIELSQDLFNPAIQSQESNPSQSIKSDKNPHLSLINRDELNLFLSQTQMEPTPSVKEPTTVTMSTDHVTKLLSSPASSESGNEKRMKALSTDDSTPESSSRNHADSSCSVSRSFAGTSISKPIDHPDPVSGFRISLSDSSENSKTALSQSIISLPEDAHVILQGPGTLNKQPAGTRTMPAPHARTRAPHAGSHTLMTQPTTTHTHSETRGESLQTLRIPRTLIETLVAAGTSSESSNQFHLSLPTGSQDIHPYVTLTPPSRKRPHSEDSSGQMNQDSFDIENTELSQPSKSCKMQFYFINFVFFLFGAWTYLVIGASKV